MINFGFMGEIGKKQELTSRQKEILSLLRKGLTNSEICFALNISANTVKVHLANIYRILEVTNRTEAVSTDMAVNAPLEDKDEITLSICHNDDFLNRPLAHTLYLAIIQALQGCNVFQIKIYNENEVDKKSDYIIKLSTPRNEGQSLSMSLYQKDSDAVLWSNLQKVESSEEIKLLAEQISIQLFRHIIRAAFETYSNNPEVEPQWWYASCDTIARMENRSRTDFEKCESLQQALLAEGRHKDFVAGALAAAYYTAATENWIQSETCIQNLNMIVGETMRENPSSIYSLYSIALYNMFLGNHREAINYFELIKFSNSPLHIVCRRMLSKMYTLTEQAEKAAKELEEYDRLIPGSMYQPFQYVDKAFHHFMQSEYQDCKKISEQLLMFHPEITYARLLLIACNLREGNLDEHTKQIRMLFEYNPNFSKDDLNRFFDCFGPSRRGQVSDLLKNLFS